MPRDGSDIYAPPPGTYGTPDTTIESIKYNTFVDDITQDLNTARPVIAGGTGATSEDEALANLGGEASSEVVTNYDSHIFFPGSFHSAGGATSPPVNGHAFSGWCYSSDPIAFPPTNNNVVVQARDLNDTVVPGRLYVREKKAGVWGVWALEGEGSGFAFLNSPVFTGNPTTPTPPVDDNDLTVPNTAWVQAELAQLAAAAQAADNVLDAAKVNKAGDTMTGHLTLPAGPGAAQAVRKDYVDTADAALNAAIALKADATSLQPIATTAQYLNNTADKTLDTDSVWGAAVPVALVEAASAVTPNFGAGIDFIWTLGGAGRTINNPTAPKLGQKGVIFLVQPAGGAATITTWGSQYKFPGGTKPVLTGAANAIDMVSYTVKSATEIFCNAGLDYK